MKAITLHQPWASFVAAGFKRVETRPWSVEHRGPLAIHAAQRPAIGEEVELELRRVFGDYVIDETLGVHDGWPHGAVVATCELVDVMPVGDVLDWLAPEELAMGNFRHGRFAWLLEDVQTHRRPILASGQQRLWEWSHERRQR